MTLKELPIGKTATVRTVGGEGALRQHFLDMGIIPGAEVTMVKYAPMGDPVEVRIHSYELTLRLADAGRIAIDEMRDAVKEKEQPDAKAIPHPGFGEGGKYHNKAEEHPLPEGELLSFALAGNQNCGKTTLFNQLTGSICTVSDGARSSATMIAGSSFKDASVSSPFKMEIRRSEISFTSAARSLM